MYDYGIGAEEKLQAMQEYQKACNEADSDDPEDKRKLEALRERLGLDEDGEPPGKVRLNEPSRLDRENINNVGYFRSSYNDGGINNVMRRTLGEPYSGYYWVFDYPDEGQPYVFRPDWVQAQARALEAIALLEKAREAAKGHSVLSLGPNAFSNWIEVPTTEVGGQTIPMDSEANVLAAFLENHLARHSDRPGFLGGNYSGREGHFFMSEPLKVKAVIWGGTPQVGFMATLRPDDPNAGRVPKVWLVVEDDSGGVHESYLDSLRVVVETCDHVLSSGHPETFYLYWSA